MAGNGFSRFLHAIGWEDEAAQERNTQSRNTGTRDRRTSAPSRGNGSPRTSAAGRAPAGRAAAGRSVVPSPASNPVSREPARSAAERVSAARPAPAYSGTESVRMVVLQPRSYEDATLVTDQLMQGKPVIMNLEGLPKEVGMRILDFVVGASYALNGTIRRVSKNIFLVAPEGVDISGTMSGGYTAHYS